MIDENEPIVIEYNCRMGDPETEVVIPRLKNDLAELLKATADQRLNEIVVDTDERTAVAVVAVSGGYPGDYEKGKIIEGLDMPGSDDSIVFHSGTVQQESAVVTNGGRVLVVTSFGNTIKEASSKSRGLLKKIYFEGINFRQDIGYEFV